MKFYLENKVFCLENDRLVLQEDNDRISGIILNSLSTSLLIKDYNKFLIYLRQELIYKKFKIFYFSLNENNLLMGVTQNPKNIFLKCIYQIENNIMLQFIKDFLGLNKGFVTIQTNHLKEQQFITNFAFLKYIFAYNYLLSTDKKIYNSFSIPKKGGGERSIISLNKSLRKLLSDANNIFQEELDKINIDFQIAYKKGKSIVSNAVIHKNNKYIVKFDFLNFFPSCKRRFLFPLLEQFFDKRFNYPKSLEMFIDSLLYEDALYIGSPISGTLANACISSPIGDIKDICLKRNIAFSIYADDMTFSSNDFIDPLELNQLIISILQKYDMDLDFRINSKKTITQKNQKRFITGIRINHEDELTVSKIIYRKLRASLHNFKSKHDKRSISKISCMINYALQIDSTGKVEKLINEYIVDVVNYNLITLKDKTKKIDIRRW